MFEGQGITTPLTHCGGLVLCDLEEVCEGHLHREGSEWCST